MIRRALVTGGAGFIGSNIASALIDEGAEVVVLDDMSSGHEDNLALLDAEVVRGDVRDERVVARTTRNVEVIFHLAASVGNKRSIDEPVLDSEINLIGTLRVLEAARMNDVPKIVFSSSAGIFGELQHLPIKEDHPINPDSPYGVSKLAAEKMCIAYTKLYDIDAACLRYFNVYGPRQRYDAYGNVIPIFAHLLLEGRPLTIFSDGEQTRDFVSVHDVVRANIAAAKASNVSGAYNIASGTSITINRLAALLGEVSDVEPTIEYAPPRPGDVRHSLADTSAARVAFGYQPSVDLGSGLREYVAWLKATTRA